MIEPPLRIAKSARERIIGNNPRADLVRNENCRSGESADRAGETFALLLCAPGEQEIAEPERQAIDEQDSIRRRFPLENAREFEPLLDDLPVRAARRPMRRDPLRHFWVARRGCRDQHQSFAGSLGTFLPISALAGARGADHEKAANATIHGRPYGDFAAAPPAGITDLTSTTPDRETGTSMLPRRSGI